MDVSSFWELAWKHSVFSHLVIEEEVVHFPKLTLNSRLFRRLGGEHGRAILLAQGEVEVGQLLALKGKIKVFLFREIVQLENL